jgi:Kef-type K+ transport system membrane component KefB
MPGHDVLFTVFLVFTGAALLAGLALYARQSLLVAYIALGMLVGPFGLGLIRDTSTVAGIGQVGIMFLLYLLGLNLHPQKLLRMLHEATWVTLASSLTFAALAIVIVTPFGYSWAERLVIGAAAMFSSTIIGLKLLPTTALHHRRAGEIMISVLLLQDILAIAVLLLLDALSGAVLDGRRLAIQALALPGLVLIGYLFERYVLIRVMRRFDRIQEFIFLAAVGWCLGMAQLAAALGLSHEMGAFIAGVTLAYNPIALYIAESLKPLRDFFLIMFFFALGAGFDLAQLPAVALPAGLLTLALLVAKPHVFRALLGRSGEKPELAWEIGVRLGQVSEFSLLIALLALHSAVIGTQASALIQAATLLSFVVSSYVIVLRFPTPIALSDRLRRD